MKISHINKTAFIYKDQKISYIDLLSRIEYFKSIIPLKEKSKSAIFMENRPEWAYSLFSTWEKDGTAVLMDVMSTAEEIAYILKDSKPSMVFVSNSSIDTMHQAIEISKQNPLIFNVDQIELSNVTAENVKELNYASKNQEDIAVIIYTSGTTGEPKGVMLSFGNLSSNVKEATKLGIINEKDTMLALLFFHHSYPLMATLLVPLSISLTIVIAEKISSDEIFKLLKENKITIIVGVPRLYTLLAKGIVKQVEASKLGKKLYSWMKKVNAKWLRKLIFKKVQAKFGGHIRCFISGGARLEPEIAEAIEVFGFTVLEGYGLTETSPISAFNSFKYNKIGSVGKPLPGVSIKIEESEIVIKGPNVMKGYYNKEKETNEVLKDGWFYTGDLGEIDKDGFVTITGRKKELIILPNGKNINPATIEDKIVSSTPYIKEIGVFDNNGMLSAIVFPDFEVLSQNKILNIGETIKWEIIDKYNTAAPDYRRIHDYTIVNSELPKTRLGKIRRFMLPDLIKKEDKIQDEKSPKDEVFKLLKDFLKDSAKKDIYLSSHIELDLGLDSIDKVDLQNFIDKTFELNIPSEKFAELMILQDLYNYIKDNKKAINKTIDNNDDENLEEIDLGHTNEKLIKLVQSVMKPSFKLYFKLQTEGLENLPKDSNFILAPNHQSFIDAQLLGSTIPLEVAKNTYSLAYYENFQSGIMKYIAENVNIITMNIDKNLREVLKKLEAVLSQKKNILIFPEGAVTRDGKLLPFKPLFAILAQRANVPVIPVAINGSRKALPLGSKIPKPEQVKIKFLKPVYPNDKGYEDLVERVRANLEKEVELE